jgi:hypothetical protein
MARCILHIGWHKTGTTAIQQTAMRHRQYLTANGIHYPGWHHNHGALLVSSVRTGDIGYYAETFLLPPKGVGAKSHKEVGLECLSNAVRDAGAGTLLLSGEDLTLLEPDEIGALVALLSPHFSEIRAIAYVRSHAGYASSAGQQLVRMGFTLREVFAMLDGGAAANPLLVMSPVPQYGRRLSAWMNALGRANVNVFSFDSLRRVNADIRAHFFTFLFSGDVGDHVCQGKADEYNQGLDTKSIHLLDRLNRMQPLLVRGAPNREIAMFAQSYFSNTGSGVFKLPEQALSSVEANARIDADILVGAFPEIVPHLAPPSAADFMPKEKWLSFDRYAQAQGTIPVLLKMARGEQGHRARATFFGALASHRHEPDDSLLDERLRSALFQMNDGLLLKSCGGWLARYEMDAYAALYFRKALNYLPQDAVLRSLERRASAAGLNAQDTSAVAES